MCGENSVTQASPSAGEVNSTDLTAKEKHREYMREYMRAYRKTRKAAKGLQSGSGVGEGMGEGGSSILDGPEQAGN